MRETEEDGARAAGLSVRYLTAGTRLWFATEKSPAVCTVADRTGDLKRVTLDEMHARSVVLLVDPCVDTLDMYRLALSYAGISAIAVRDGLSALHHARMSGPQVIVTELDLSGRTSGWDLITTIQADAMARQTPIVVLTAHAEASLPERAYRAGCVAFLTKPCLPDTLVKLIQQLLPNKTVVAGRQEPHAHSPSGTSSPAA